MYVSVHVIRVKLPEAKVKMQEVGLRFVTTSTGLPVPDYGCHWERRKRMFLIMPFTILIYEQSSKSWKAVHIPHFCLFPSTEILDTYKSQPQSSHVFFLIPKCFLPRKSPRRSYIIGKVLQKKKKHVSLEKVWGKFTHLFYSSRVGAGAGNFTIPHCKQLRKVKSLKYENFL